MPSETPSRIRLTCKTARSPSSSTSASSKSPVGLDDEPLPTDPSSRPSVEPDQFTQGEIVTIFVGSKRKGFHIYKDLLRAKSPYFAASLKYCWNGDTDEVYLNEDANAFGHFTNWMFRDTIPAVDLGSPEGLADITSFYKLADFLLVEDLRNAIMDAILKYLKNHNWDLNFFSLSFLREQNLRTTPLYKLALRSSVRMFVRGPDRFEDGGDNDFIFLSDKPELCWTYLKGFVITTRSPGIWFGNVTDASSTNMRRALFAGDELDSLPRSKTGASRQTQREGLPLAEWLCQLCS